MYKILGSKYFKLALTVFLTGALLLLFYQMASNFTEFRNGISEIVSIISPFIYGFVLAYLVSPIYNVIVKFSYKVLSKKTARKLRCFMLCKVIATIITLVIMLALVSGMIALVIPQLVDSIVGIVNTLPGKLDQVTNWIENYADNMDNEMLAEKLNEYGNQMQTSTIEWAQDTLLPGIGTMMQRISSSVILTLKKVMNILIGLIITVYLLNSKETFKAQIKKTVYSLLSRENAESLFEFGRFTNKTFGGFINGKLIDSLIIGIICFIAMSILKLPYPILISTIIGVSNIIPFFGPIIGAVPSAMLLFLISPMQALYFVIMVIVLQQLDGNIIGPAIIGNTTGLTSFWVMFAIVVGGGLFGFMGMVLSVPIFAVIYFYIGRAVENRLKKKGLDHDTREYIKYDSYDIDKEEIL